MQYTPKTEKECSQLIDPGQYPFEILEAHDTDEYGEVLRTRGKKDSNGNWVTRPTPMVMLKIKLWDINGIERQLNDYIVLNDQFAFKLRHLADSIGELDKYDTNILKVQDLISKMGVASIIIAKSKDPKYGDQNSVKDYVKKENQQPLKEKEPDFSEDDLPNFN